ncbi:hypothetical protein ABZ714_01170 [Streptomyces sp. NPDC006798]|uniref:hypothetical protein n=1 Tax=Streptomyces sp. NPDC006798 TaxID=3155462 RepID=UPI0033C2716A
MPEAHPRLTPADLSLMLLVTSGPADRPMPTVTIGQIPSVVRDCVSLGIPSVKVFAEASVPDDTGTHACAPDSLMARAIRTIKSTEPGVAVMTESCLCSYTTAGLCYLIDRYGRPDEIATAHAAGAQAVAHAEAGADVVGPASMVLGAVGHARRTLNETGHTNVGVMPHVIFWSRLYDAFRRILGATPQGREDREFQVHPAKPEQFVDTALGMVRDGADMPLLGPALFSVDVLTVLRNHTRVPIFPFSVSGEYRPLAPMSPDGGGRDYGLLLELAVTTKRAGATALLTYAARDLARRLP